MTLADIHDPGPEFADGAVIPGYSTRVTRRGVRVLSLDVEADPAKRDPAWLAAQRATYPTETAFRRELRRDWTAGEGDVFFPEWFENGGRERYVQPIPYLLTGPIYRGWDFGRRAPACVWFQYDRKNKRLLVLRSVTPSYMGIHHFRDLVLYLSGQLPFSALEIPAQNWVAKIEEDPTQPKTPWFQGTVSRPLQFVDYGGYEARQDSDMVREESAALSRKAVLAEAGIYLSEMWAATNRDTLMRKLMGVRPDGWPGVLIDPANPCLIQGLGGGLVFKKPTAEDPMPIVYMKDGIHDNVYEALLYGVVGVVDLVEHKSPLPMVTFPDRRRVETYQEDGLFHESRPGQPKGVW